MTAAALSKVRDGELLWHKLSKVPVRALRRNYSVLEVEIVKECCRGTYKILYDRWHATCSECYSRIIFNLGRPS